MIQIICVLKCSNNRQIIIYGSSRACRMSAVVLRGEGSVYSGYPDLEGGMVRAESAPFKLALSHNFSYCYCIAHYFQAFFFFGSSRFALS